MQATTQVEEFMAKQAHADKRRPLLHTALRTILPLLYRVDVQGLDRVPKSGASILMMNHMAFMDPVLCTAIVRHRWVVSMAKAETMEGWFSRLIVDLWGNFPIRRGEIDRQALANAIALLKHGNLLLIAPEGTRNPDTGLQTPRDGMAYLVHKANATIIPTAVVGASDWRRRWMRLRRAYANISFGRPFRFRLPDGERLTREIRENMMREAMYQLAMTIPDAYADKRGRYQDIGNASTNYLDFVG